MKNSKLISYRCLFYLVFLLSCSNSKEKAPENSRFGQAAFFIERFNLDASQVNNIYMVVSKGCPNCMEPTHVLNHLRFLKQTENYLILTNVKSIYNLLQANKLHVFYDQQNIIARINVPANSLLKMTIRDREISSIRHEQINKLQEVEKWTD